MNDKWGFKNAWGNKLISTGRNERMKKKKQTNKQMINENNKWMNDWLTGNEQTREQMNKWKKNETTTERCKKWMYGEMNRYNT